MTLAQAVAECKDKMDKSVKYYEQELDYLQTELVKLQYWIRATGERVVIVFEGRDAAGKGGTIKRLTDKGFGFIESDGESYFVHITKLLKKTPLEVGLEVEFSPVETTKGKQAFDVIQV